MILILSDLNYWKDYFYCIVFHEARMQYNNKFFFLIRKVILNLELLPDSVFVIILNDCSQQFSIIEKIACFSVAEKVLQGLSDNPKSNAQLIHVQLPASA